MTESTRFQRDQNVNDNAACTSYPQEWWFPDIHTEFGHQDTINGIRVCHGCPVKLQCAEMAADIKPHYGIWGGLVWADGKPRRTQPDYVPADTSGTVTPTTGMVTTAGAVPVGNSGDGSGGSHGVSLPSRYP